MKTLFRALYVSLPVWILFTPIMIETLHSQPTLLASWSFNNNTNDASGNGFDATLRGNAGYSEDAAKGSHSLLLNGEPDYVRVGAFDFGDEFTICAWAFLEIEQTNIQTIIGNAMGGSAIDGFKLFINNWETNNKRIIIETSDGTTRLDAVSPENTFEEGFWNHVAVTIDRPNGVAQIYYNGEEVTESGAIVPDMQVTQSVTIGSMSGPDWYWTGMIDDVRIYQGLLTVDEIDNVMNSPETSVREKPAKIVDNFDLCNFPNPFNSGTTFAFDIKDHRFVELDIVNARGEHIRKLVHGTKAPGQYRIVWDGLDESGQPVSSGVYFSRITVGAFSQKRKILLVR